MAQASPADKDIQPGTGPCGLSGPHHYLPGILAEIPVVTRRQVEQLRAEPIAPVEPLSLLFGLVLGVIIGVIIRDSLDRR
jgi:hypothetical protein